MESFRLVYDYKDMDIYRQSFNRLAHHVFGIDFEEWYKHGFWNERYVCFSFLHDEEIVANVSINQMDLILDGEDRKALQIGTVMTHPEYRNKGLSGELMNRVLDRYGYSYDLLYLSANPDVLGYYPRFGFRPCTESRFVWHVNNGSYQKGYLQKLDVSRSDHLQLIHRFAVERRPISNTFGVTNACNLFMWYCFNIFTDCFYYAKEEDTLLVCKREKDVLHLFDVVSHYQVNFSALMRKALHPNIKKVIFHFTPDLMEVDAESYFIESGDVFFIKGSSLNVNGPFKYPIMAQA